jgi:hypothetical protein
MDEALHRWGRICSRARTGQSGRRGEARLIDGRGGVVEEIDIDAMVRAAGARAVHH